MREADIMNDIRLHISQQRIGTLFRVNVGQAWTGNHIVTHPDHVAIYGARPFKTGLPVGFPDLFGFAPVIITPEMVGKTMAVFVGIEVKTPRGRIRPGQMNMIYYMAEHGCRVGVARNKLDAEAIVAGRR